MADITLDDMVVGTIVYDLIYTFETMGYAVRKARVLGPVNEDRFIPMLDCVTGALFKLFPGDKGIAPAAYDKRVTQVFRTEEEAEIACKAWRDLNPNFLLKEES